MQLNAAAAKYSLLLRSYPDVSTTEDVCELLYHSRDPKLVGTMTSLPYAVGRSFTGSEMENLRQMLEARGVGFIFKSTHPGFENIEFDPTQKTKSENQPPQQLGMKRSAYKWARSISWALLSLIVLGVGYIWMVNQQTSLPLPEFSKETSPSMGTRATLSKIVQRVEIRKDRDLLWNPATERQGLEDRDALRTFAEAFATVTYLEGSQIIVKPDSLVIIGELSNPVEREIELTEGVVAARLKYAEPPETLSIQTKVGRLQMKGPTSKDQKESRIETKMKGDQWEVNLSAGEATLIPSANSDSPITLGPAQKIEVTPEGAKDIQAYTPEIKLLEPTADSMMKVDPNKSEAFRFSWEPFEPLVTYRWVLASDEKMSSLLLEQTTTDTQISVNYLDLGTVYWQVSAVSEGETIALSPVFKLHVQKHGD